jgi:hypothetical protein
MTAKEAYEKIVKWQPNMKVLECYEYDTLFTFQLVPSEYSVKDIPLNGLFSVDKKTGSIRSFKPFNIPITEYRKGKKITDFK